MASIEEEGGGRDGASSSFIQVETLPDLLKNTPSNIARLVDAIEHCEGRQKYLARTKSPSDGEDVRWYFCKVPLAEKELAASVPQTEIVGKSDYFRFSMRDSLALEASFLQREEELLAYWWKEYAECSEGPCGQRLNNNIISDHKSDELYAIDEDRVGVPVKGGLYEVDLPKRHCFPVYWHGEYRRVLRGHWFGRKGGLEWLPLREDIAEQLELAYRLQVWHRRTFQPSGLFAARIDIQGTTQGLHALFTGEDDTWEAWLVLDKSGFSFNLASGNGVRVRRGFASSGSLKPTQDELRQQKEEEMDDYCSQVPVGHLVFMVHGIGQRLEKANLVDDVGDFRRITASLSERHLTPYQRSTQRVLFIPCQWRKGLKLSGESAVEQITLDGVRGLRVALSATVHDVLYYMSPVYCQDIIDSVSNQLNRLYMKFLKRNPGYDGKVSIYAHSLGSVLSYDILCHQESSYSAFPMESVHMEGVDEQRSQVDAPHKSVTLIDAVTSENSNTEIIDAAMRQPPCTMVEGGSVSCGIASEEITCNPCCTPDTIDVISRNYEFSEPDDDSHCCDQETTDEKQQCIMPLLGEDDQKLSLDPKAVFRVEDKDLNTIPIVASRDTENDAVTTTDSLPEDTIDKDKLISFLEEDLQYLRARIAELEQNHHRTAYLTGENDGGPKLSEGLVNGVRSTMVQSSLEKFPPEHDDSRKSYTPNIRYTKLDFKVDTFFAVGSPLGVFLALRNIRIGIGRGKDYWQDEKISEEMPSCRQMYNIFHPFDPVAYRVEPLVCKEYVSKRPVIIPYHRGGKRLHIGFQEFTEDLAARSKAMKNNFNSVRVKVVSICQSRNTKDDEAVEDIPEKERSYGSIMIERVTGSEDGRIDHVLQDKTFEHPYISALGSHTNYWRDHDTALFILNHLYRDIPEEPQTAEQDGRAQKPVKLFYERDVMDEETPLTFSDHVLKKEFSREAKKIMNTPR